MYLYVGNCSSTLQVNSINFMHLVLKETQAVLKSMFSAYTLVAFALLIDKSPHLKTTQI